MPDCTNNAADKPESYWELIMVLVKTRNGGESEEYGLRHRNDRKFEIHEKTVDTRRLDLQQVLNALET
jgi:hypothetical protein